jgi:hypothetical protein
VGVGLITVGVERLGYRLSLSHIAEGEWRATFSAHPMWASVGYGVAASPWRAVQIAAGTSIRQHLLRVDRAGGSELGSGTQGATTDVLIRGGPLPHTGSL